MDSKNVLKNSMPAEYKMVEQRGRKRRHEVCALDQGDYKIRLSKQLWKKGKENLQMKKLLRILLYDGNSVSSKGIPSCFI